MVSSVRVMTVNDRSIKSTKRVITQFRSVALARLGDIADLAG